MSILRTLLRVSLGAVVLLGPLSCGNDLPLPETPPSLPEAYQGRWHYLGSSGGIAGTGLGDDATGSIVIGADGAIDYYDEDGEHLRTEANAVEYGSSIFSQDSVWLLDPEAPAPRALLLNPDGTLTIADNVYDGFSQRYARTP